MIKIDKILESWELKDFKTNTNNEIIKWVDSLNKDVKVSINKCNFSECIGWHFDNNSGYIVNNNGGFFQVAGFKGVINESYIEQPIIIQDEIGYLGFICSIVDGVLQFLIQAKIEPGNVNKIQLSPTIQATKSNFTQLHGGKKPKYLEYFVNADCNHIIVDQIQSEQGSRFFKKRNRNIIIFIEEEIDVLPNFKWMTLGQIKHLMSYNNMVNMDTRTVISCIPIWNKLDKNERLMRFFDSKEKYNSFFNNDSIDALEIFNYFSTYRMFSKNKYEIAPLTKLSNWKICDKEIICLNDYPFKTIYCKIEIEGREVKNWCQPLFEACGKSVFALMMCEIDGKFKFLVKAINEVGSFDKVELGATIQREPNNSYAKADKIQLLFDEKISKKEGIIRDCILSEEGGRFYCEENRNIIMMVKKEDLLPLPNGYFLYDYKTLNYLVQFNNILNIQLRNLLSMLEI